MAKIFTGKDRLWRTALNRCSRCIQAVRTDSKPTVVLTVLVVVVHCICMYSLSSPVVRYGFRRAMDDVILDTMLDPGNGECGECGRLDCKLSQKSKDSSVHALRRQKGYSVGMLGRWLWNTPIWGRADLVPVVVSA